MQTEGPRRVAAVIKKDLDGVITEWDRGAERLFGFAADEVVARPLLLLVPPDCQERETAILERFRRGLLLKTYHTVRKAKNGRRIAVTLTARRAPDGTGVIEIIQEPRSIIPAIRARKAPLMCRAPSISDSHRAASAV